MKSIWAWYCDQPYGGYLFHGNPNPTMQAHPYHLSDVYGLIDGQSLVWAETRRVLEMEIGVHAWNLAFPQFKVEPVLIMVEVRPYYKRKKVNKVKT